MKKFISFLTTVAIMLSFVAIPCIKPQAAVPTEPITVDNLISGSNTKMYYINVPNSSSTVPGSQTIRFEGESTIRNQYGSEYGRKIFINLADYYENYDSVKSFKLKFKFRKRDWNGAAEGLGNSPTVMTASSVIFSAAPTYLPTDINGNTIAFSSLQWTDNNNWNLSNGVEHLWDYENDYEMIHDYTNDEIATLKSNGIITFIMDDVDFVNEFVAACEDGTKMMAFNLFLDEDDTNQFSYDLNALGLTIEYLNVDDLDVMEEVYISRYLSKFVGETANYAEFKTLTEEGQTAVISNINTIKSSLTDAASLDVALATAIESYFASNSLVEDDIDNAIAHYNAATQYDIDVYNNFLTDAAAETVTEGFLAANRSGVNSAATLNAVFKAEIAEYYATGNIDESEQQVKFMIDTSTNLFGEPDASIQGISNGISIQFINSVTPDYTNLKVFNGNNEVTSSVTGNILSINTVEAETEYKIKWTNLAEGVYDSEITFTTTGIYEMLNVALANDVLKEGETTNISGVVGTFGSGRRNTSLTYQQLNVTVDNANAYTYSNGTFAAVKRGISAVNYEKTENEGQALPTTKNLLFVYNNLEKSTFDDGTEVSEPIDGKTLSLSAETTFTSEFDADAMSGWFYKADTDYSFTVAIGSDTFTVDTTNLSVGWHQFAVVVGVDTTFYINGTEADDSTSTNKFTSAAITPVSGTPILDNVSLIDVYGTLCYVDFVKVQNIDNTLTGSYKYYDADEDDKETENGTIIKWYKANSSTGTKTEISGETSLTISNASDYAGKYIYFEVTPKNNHDTGASVISSPLYIKEESNGKDNSGGNNSSKDKNSITGGIGNLIADYKANTITPTTKPEAGNNTNTQTTFSDVSGHWAAESINTLAKSGILNGYEDGTFKPQGNVTRAEFLCALLKALNVETKTYVGNFSDMNTNDWYAGFVQAAIDSGIVNGFEDGTFGADRLITREQMATILAKALGLTETTDLAYADNGQISQWAKDGVAKVTAAGIMQGKEANNFASLDNATRAEMATIINRILNR